MRSRGGSFPSLRIGDDAYSGVFRTVMRAIYHQRCGTALDRRHTRFIHGECHRQQVVASGLRFGEEGQDGVFRELPKRATGEVLKDAWGGYHDAGDYDRHTCHMTVPYRLLEVYEAFPRKFHDNQLGIPESRNGNPDIVDEARWGIDVFRRLQDRRDGGVHGGIETFEHPNFGVAPDSAVERTIPLWAFAKDGASSLFFAAVTARACRVYRMIGRRRDANLMLRCATRAWRYGLGEYPRLKAVCHWDLPYRREDVVALAAAELYRTTGRDAYHRAFLSRYRLRKHPGIVIHKSWHDRCLALVASVYLGTPYARDRKAVAASAGALREYAEESIRWTERLGYRVARAPDAFRGWGSLTGQSWHEPLLRAAIAFGGHEARRYRDWAGHVADTWLGGNPAGMSWLTGVGARHVNNPLHIPSLNDGIPEPVPGIPFYGPIARRAADKWSATALGTMTPPASRTPDPLCFTDMNIFASMTEFTVWQCHAPCAALFGWLAPDTGERGRGRG
jgi:endoglucanase